MNYITYEQEGFVGIITINRPKALNALNSEVLKELDACLDGVNLKQLELLFLLEQEKNHLLLVQISEK